MWEHIGDYATARIFMPHLLHRFSMRILRDPGHAMKVSDTAKAHGAILGKAMTTLEDGRGLVLVLVTLQ